MMVTEKRRATVVLGMDPTGLAVVRSLGRKGVEIVGVDACPLAVGFTSRYCRRRIRYDPVRQEAELLRRLLKTRNDFSRDPVIIAANDEALVFLARNGVALRKSFVFSRLDTDILDQFLNKKRFYQSCSRINVALPRTAYPETENELPAAADLTGFPCIIKPIYTHLWAKKYGLKKVMAAENLAELIRLYRGLDEAMKGNVIIQEIIPGSDEDIYIFAGYFDRNSRPRAVFTGKKLRQFPPGFGTTTYAESVWIPEVARLSERLLEGFRYNGLCDVEFKRDKRDNVYKIIEINPRPGRWYSLVESSGINVVYRAYLDLSGEETGDESRFRLRRKKWMLISRDIFSALAYVKKGKLSISSWLESLLTPKNLATFAVDDPWPFLGYILEMIYKSAGQLANRVDSKKTGTRCSYVGPSHALTGKDLFNMIRPAKTKPFPEAIPTFMGRDALALAISGLGLKKQETVLLPSYLCEEVLNPFMGKTQVEFYRLGPGLTIEPEEIAARLKKGNVKTVLTINYFGFLQPHLKEIREICLAKNVFLLEDCAHSPLTSGAGETGDLVLYSFRKVLPIPDGGGLKINNRRINAEFFYYPKLAVDLLAAFIILKSKINLRSGNLSRGRVVSRLKSVIPRTRSRAEPLRLLPMSDWAANGMARASFSRIVKKRRDNFACWRKLSDRTDFFRPLFAELPPGACPLGFPVTMKKRDETMRRLERKGIFLKVHWPLPPAVGGEFVDSRRLSAEIVTLPVYPELGREEIEAIYECVVSAKRG